MGDANRSHLSWLGPKSIGSRAKGWSLGLGRGQPMLVERTHQEEKLGLEPERNNPFQKQGLKTIQK